MLQDAHIDDVGSGEINHQQQPKYHVYHHQQLYAMQYAVESCADE